MLFSVSLFANINNNNFETGSYTNWISVSGNAFQHPTDKSVSTLVSWEDSYYANSGYPNNSIWNEAAVGVLRSAIFSYPTNSFITFFIAGHSTHFVPITNNYVVLKLASNGAVLDKVFTYDYNVFRKAVLKSTAAYGKDVYLEVVDDCSETGWAWIAVDDFQLKSFSDNLIFKYWETPINDDIISGGNEIHSPLSNLPDLDWSLVKTHPAFGCGVKNFDLSESLRLEKMFVQFEGYIDISETGNYTFYLNSDDGSKLWIDGALIVDNDGVKSLPVEVSGTTNLDSGKHIIRVGYFHRTGSPVLDVSWSGPSISKEIIPENVLSTAGISGTTDEFVSFMTIMPDDERIWNYCPTFLYDEVEGLYKIWSGGEWSPNGDTIVYKESKTLEGLKYAASQAVLSPSGNDSKFDGTHSCDPNVFCTPNGDFYMTYSGFPTTSSTLEKTTRIGIAKSADRGRTWTKLYNGDHIIEPDFGDFETGAYGDGQSSVVRANDGYYYLIYTDQPYTNRLGKIKVIRCLDPEFPIANHEVVTNFVATPGGVGHASLDLAYDTFRKQFNIIYGVSDNPNLTNSPRTGVKMSFFDKNWKLIETEVIRIYTGFALAEGFALLQNLNKEPIQYFDRGVPTIVIAAATHEDQNNCSTFHAPWVDGDTKYVTLPYDLSFSFDDNHSFEMGTLTNWTAIGPAWEGQPLTTNWPSSGYDGDFHVCSFLCPAGVNVTGILKSANFSLDANEQLSFYIGGWSKVGGEGMDFSYVTLNRTSDKTELDRVWAPGITGVMDLRQLSHGLNENIEVYIEVVDNDTAGTGWGWISVDDFDKVEYNFWLGKNNGFELGNFSNWTVSGTAFGSVPRSYDNQGRAGWHGRYFANSSVGGEPAVGTLRSANFSFGNNSTATFWISGWSSWTGAGSPAYNYVALKRASDDSELDRVWTPNVTHTMFEKSFVAPQTAVDVYIEVVDNCTSGGYSWIAVDDFQLDYIPEPISIISCLISIIGIFFVKRKKCFKIN